MIMPGIEEISEDKQFIPELISQAEFELIWNQYFYFLSWHSWSVVCGRSV